VDSGARERMKRTRVSRRSFVATAAVTLAQADEPSPWRFFTPAEAALTEAICEQIVPADDAPGARQAGVIYYIDTQLSGTLKRFGRYYRAGLPLLDAACRERTGLAFQELPFDRQTQFLLTVDKGDPLTGEWRLQSARSFFTMIVDHTMQGFYGSPRHGGNRNGASWKMLGIEEQMSYGPHGGHK
jgi:gluconate 2-dehydrogenase gamma chain